MLAVVFPKPDQFTLQSVTEPQAGPGQVVVRVKSTTICATDLKIFHGQFPGVSYPHIPGHEWGGEIVQVGAGITNLRTGDRVGVIVQPLITHHLPLSDFAQAWELFQERRENVIRVMLHP